MAGQGDNPFVELGNGQRAYLAPGTRALQILNVSDERVGSITREGAYRADDGGTVTQITSITTGVTLSTLSGQITTVSATLAENVEAVFVVTNTLVEATDVVIAVIGSTPSAGAPVVYVTAVAAGSFDITLGNLDAAALDDTVTINFVVIKGSSS